MFGFSTCFKYSSWEIDAPIENDWRNCGHDEGQGDNRSGQLIYQRIRIPRKRELTCACERTHENYLTKLSDSKSGRKTSLVVAQKTPLLLNYWAPDWAWLQPRVDHHRFYLVPKTLCIRYDNLAFFPLLSQLFIMADQRPQLPSAGSSPRPDIYGDPFADRPRQTTFTEPERPFHGSASPQPRPFESTSTLPQGLGGQDNYDDDDYIERQPLNAGGSSTGGFYPPQYVPFDEHFPSSSWYVCP